MDTDNLKSQHEQALSFTNHYGRNGFNFCLAKLGHCNTNLTSFLYALIGTDKHFTKKPSHITFLINYLVFLKFISLFVIFILILNEQD